jgi:hypothetical protein
MSKVVIDLSMSLDGFIAGPGDARKLPLGGRGGEHLFDWYFDGDTPYESRMFSPKAPIDRSSRRCTSRWGRCSRGAGRTR